MKKLVSILAVLIGLCLSVSALADPVFSPSLQTMIDSHSISFQLKVSLTADTPIDLRDIKVYIYLPCDARKTNLTGYVDTSALQLSVSPYYVSLDSVSTLTAVADSAKGAYSLTFAPAGKATEAVASSAGTLNVGMRFAATDWSLLNVAANATPVMHFYWKDQRIYPAATLSISSEAPADGRAGTAYAHSFLATAASKFSISEGALPDGLSLSEAGELTGTPTLAGSYSFTVLARSSDDLATQAVVLEIAEAEVAPPPVSVPETGDTAHLLAWAVMLAAGLVGCVLLRRQKRSRS